MACRARCGKVSLQMLLMVLFTLVLWVVPSAAQCSGPISEGEYQALYSLYNATNGTHWAWRNATEILGEPWVFNTSSVVQGGRGGAYLSDPCAQPWQGLVCGSLPLSVAQCCISVVTLGEYNLRGKLPQELDNLSQLEYLYLYTNSLTGPIPSSLGDLALLSYLDLSVNCLTGPIPSSLGNLALLSELDLTVNSLTGPIPSSLGNLTRLDQLYLDTNSLTGPIPSSMGDLAVL